MEEDLLMMVLMPEMLTKAQERYEILRWIYAMGPIGRHLLSAETHLSDGSVQNHLRALEREGLVYEEPSGFLLTSKGSSLVEPLSSFLMKRPANKELEKELKGILSMKRVIVVRGDSDISINVKKDISREAALLMLSTIRDHEVIAVGGGSMVSAIPELLPALHMDVSVVPACGGFGEKVEDLPNLTTARLAERLGGKYRILHVPDGISIDLVRRIKKEIPEENDVNALIGKTTLLVIGINSAEEAARIHDLPEDVRVRLRKQHAVGQSLGLYADINGRILYRVYGMGITLEDIPSIPNVLIMAGGRQKAASILGMARAGVRGTLVTDEGAGKELLRMAAGDYNED